MAGIKELSPSRRLRRRWLGIDRLLPSLLLLLGSGLHLFPDQLMAAPPPQILQGRIERQIGNRMPGPALPPAPPGAAQELVAVDGALQPQQAGDPFLPAAALRAPVLGRTRSDARGAFSLRLPAGMASRTVTLLLVVPGGYYLNAFDHTGRFASLNLPAAAGQPLILRDDRGALF